MTTNDEMMRAQALDASYRIGRLALDMRHMLPMPELCNVFAGVTCTLLTLTLGREQTVLYLRALAVSH